MRRLNNHRFNNENIRSINMDNLRVIRTCDKHLDSYTELAELIKIANDDDNGQCRCKAIDELARRKDPLGANAIFNIILKENEDRFIKEQCALSAIAKMDGNLVLDLMEKKLEEPDKEVHRHAIEVIGEHAKRGNGEAVLMLMTIADNEAETRHNRGRAKLLLGIIRDAAK